MTRPDHAAPPDPTASDVADDRADPHDPGRPTDVSIRRRAAVVAGHRGDVATARRATSDDDATVRQCGLGALARLGDLSCAELAAAASDEDDRVRRRAAALCARVAPGDPGVDAVLANLVDDTDHAVIEVAAWAIGERWGIDPDTAEPRADMPRTLLDALVRLTGHGDDACRESAAAALGATGQPAGRAALMRLASHDRPAVRRRAVIALAAHLDHRDAVAALTDAGHDRDWQVREAAEVLLRDLADDGLSP